jgi:1-acyl-sn-glycerol-3-phosphate acyltransferase
MPKTEPPIRYPRRRLMRAFLQGLDWLAFTLLTKLEIIGRENCPKKGPLIVVANHFDFADPVLMVRVAPWPLDFWGGFRMPHAPAYLTWIPKLWGFYHVHRGGYSREAIRAGEAVLQQGGILGIFPEAGNWATVLRRPRPGTAFLAARTGVPLLPMGFDGLGDVFPALGHGRRARVTARIGKVFGPFAAPEEGPDHRRRIDEIGDEIMRHIAALIPPEKRGVYSDDPAARALAEQHKYPFAEKPDI